MSKEIPIAKSTEDDIQKILDNQEFENHMNEATKTEMEIQKTHENSEMHNMIAVAHKIESAIQSDHEQQPLYWEFEVRLQRNQRKGDLL